MNNVISVETAVCSEHQRLVAESEKALEIWNEHRAEFCKADTISKEAGDELLRLQARYARAYTALQGHEHHCSLCRLLSKAEEHNFENSSDPFFETIV